MSNPYLNHLDWRVRGWFTLYDPELDDASYIVVDFYDCVVDTDHPDIVQLPFEEENVCITFEAVLMYAALDGKEMEWTINDAI